MGLKVISGDLPFWGKPRPGKRGAIVPRKQRVSMANLVSSEVTIPIESIQFIAQNEVKHGSSAAGTAANGCLLGFALNLFLGPIGFVLGLLASGNPGRSVQEVTFHCRLRDGRTFMAVCDPATYQQFLASAASCGATLPGQVPQVVSSTTMPFVAPSQPVALSKGSKVKAGQRLYFIARPDGTHGPYRFDEINRFLAAGQLTANDLAWSEGCPGWIPISQISGVKLPRR